MGVPKGPRIQGGQRSWLGSHSGQDGDPEMVLKVMGHGIKGSGGGPQKDARGRVGSEVMAGVPKLSQWGPKRVPDVRRVPKRSRRGS